MKRLLLAAMAVAAAAAWTVPSTATASEITFSGQYRLRGEYRNNADFTNENYSVRDGATGAPASIPAPNVNNTANDSTNMWVQRVRLTANAKATDDTSVKITLQDTRTWGVTGANNAGGGPQLTDNGSNTLDTHEAYLNVANVFGAPVALRAGRQELAYGDERLLGSFGWNNNGRAFDAFKLMYSSDIVNVDLFTSRINVASSNTDGTQTESLHGLYATVKAVPNNTIDLYVLNLRNRETAPAANTFGNATGSNNGLTGGPFGAYYGTQTLYTYGIRLKGDVAGADYTFELPYQTGTIHRRGSTLNPTTVPPTFSALRNDMNVKAYAYAAKVGYTLTVPVKTRIGVEYDFASGDKHPVRDATTGAAFNNNDSEINTFYNLYPTNHDKLGLMDMQAWRNVKAWNVNVTVDPTDKLKLFASYWKFALAAKEDGWYGAGDWNVASGTGGGVGNAVHLTPTNTTPNNNNYTSDIGSEFDFVATYKYNTALTIEAGAAHFWAGDFIKNQYNTPGSVANDVTGQDWAYLQLTANF